MNKPELREAGAQAEEKRDQFESALADAIINRKIAPVGIVMDSSSWVICATNRQQ